MTKKEKSLIEHLIVLVLWIALIFYVCIRFGNIIKGFNLGAEPQEQIA